MSVLFFTLLPKTGYFAKMNCQHFVRFQFVSILSLLVSFSASSSELGFNAHLIFTCIACTYICTCIAYM